MKTAKKTALITGITGQDGSYLAELLLEKGYTVHGIVRRASNFNTERLEHLINDPALKGCLALHYGDLTDATNLNRLIQALQPDEVYNLAAMSHVKVSFDMPEYAADVDGIGALRLLEAIRATGVPTRFYQASTSELYGKVQEVPQTEKTPFYPRSPYGVAKLFAYWMTINYREAYGMYACNGILFNHESPRRGHSFVTRKITHTVAQIASGKDIVLLLGNLDAERDWGYAKDYVEGMWRMLQQEKPEDFVLATGKKLSVRRFVELAFSHIGRRVLWQGHGVDEKGLCAETGRLLVSVDPRYFRPAEVDHLLGDPTKAERLLGWKAQTSVEELIALMVAADVESVCGSNSPALSFV